MKTNALTGRMYATSAVIGILFALLTLLVFQGASKPNPTPGPVDPNPGPVDPKPDESPFGAEELAYQGAIKVKSKSRPAECRQMAASCRAVAADIDSGKLKPVTPVSNALATEMQKLPRTWYPFFNEATGFIKRFYSEGKLKTPARWSLLLNETAAGLERAAKEPLGVRSDGEESDP